jgi:hypothetical protein
MFGFYSIGIRIIVEALNNPQNRHETRVRYGCNDETLYLHPEWLILTYLEKGNTYGKK